MRRLAIGLLLATLPNAYVLPGQQQNQQEKQRPANRANAPIRRAFVQDAILGFYVEQFQKQAEVSPDVFAKILPFIQQFIKDRFEISQRRTRALNQLRQAVTRGASEEDLKRVVHDFDSADRDVQGNQEKFLSNVDPFLNPRQQARVRLLQINADNRLRQMLEAVQTPPAAPANPPPVQPN